MSKFKFRKYDRKFYVILGFHLKCRVNNFKKRSLMDLKDNTEVV